MDKAEVYETLNAAYFSDAPHEAEVMAHLPMLLGGVAIAVDAGASLGQYTRALNRLLDGAEIHAFEPDPMRYEELARNCAEWRRGSRNSIIPHQVALGNESGDSAFFVTNTNVSGGLSSRHVDEDVEWEQIRVPLARLDDVFRDRAPDFVKIDVEGAETALLEGAVRSLGKRPVFLVETHGDPSPVRALMRRHGYLSSEFFGRTVFVKDRWLWIKLKLKAMADLHRLRQRIRARLQA
jgi:FkbM family methyltransferase